MLKSQHPGMLELLGVWQELTKWDRTRILACNPEKYLDFGDFWVVVTTVSGWGKYMMIRYLDH